MQEITLEAFTASNQQAGQLAGQIKDAIGSKFSFFRLKDTFVLTDEKTKQIIQILDSVCLIRKRDNKYELILDKKERVKYLQERIDFYKDQVQVFSDSLEYFTDLTKFIKDEENDSSQEQSTEPQTLSSESPGSTGDSKESAKEEENKDN